MKTVREMFVSLTTMLINHIWASIIEICVEKWRTQSLKKIEIQMSRHEKRYRSEEIAPVVQQLFQSCLEMVVPKLILISLKFSHSCIKVVPKWFPVCLQVKLSQSSPKFVSKLEMVTQTRFKGVSK